MLQQLGLFEEFVAPSVPRRIGAAAVGIRERSAVLAKGGADYLGCDYTLNPYVGCSFGCSYCYASFYVPDEQKRIDWGKWVDVKIDAERQIARADLKGAKILMSSATDPYQPLEAKVQLTRRIVELLSEPKRQPRLAVQTRSPLVTRDIDLFHRFESIRVNMSITTDSDAIRKRFEPGCASIEQRFAAIERVSAAGIPVGISIAPMLLIEDPHTFGKRIAALQPVKVFGAMFHQAKHDFQANTRSGAWAIAKEFGWTEDRYWENVQILRRYLPDLRA